MDFNGVMSSSARVQIVKDKARKAILDFLRETQKIQEFVYDGDDEEDQQDTVVLTDIAQQDDHDGIIPKTVAMFKEEEKETRRSLKSRVKQMLHSDNPEMDDSDINFRGKWGFTKLHFAAVDNNIVECNRLLAAGANKSIKDNAGHLPWEKAMARGHFALAKLLRS